MQSASVSTARLSRSPRSTIRINSMANGEGLHKQQISEEKEHFHSLLLLLCISSHIFVPEMMLSTTVHRRILGMPLEKIQHLM
jgi:hypothetical protein